MVQRNTRLIPRTEHSSSLNLTPLPYVYPQMAPLALNATFFFIVDGLYKWHKYLPPGLASYVNLLLAKLSWPAPYA